MKKWQLVNIENNETISKHKSLLLANNRLKKNDAVRYTNYATDVEWLKIREYAYCGYKYKVLPIK